MSEVEKLAAASTSKVETKAKLMNAQTQHGCEETADEENIIVFPKSFSFSPVRETPDEVVWHEEFTETQRAEDEDDVSWTILAFLYKYRIPNYFQWSNFLPEENFWRKPDPGFASSLDGLIERLNSILRLLNVYTLGGALSEENCIHRRESQIRSTRDAPRLWAMMNLS